MVTPTIRRRIVDLRLRGLGRNETHHALRKYVKSSGTVTNVYNEFVSLANQEGISHAAEEFGVSETVRELEEIGRICRRNKMDLTEVIELEKQAKKLKDLETSHGMSFQELFSEYQDAVTKLQEMREEKKKLANEIEELKTERTRTLRQSEVNEKQLEDYSEMKGFLASIGLETADLERTKNFFINLKKEKFNARSVISKLNRAETLRESISHKNETLGDLEVRIEDNQRLLNKASTDLEGKKALVGQVRRIEETGLSLDAFESIRRSIVRISKKRRVSPMRAVARFEEEIAKAYDPLLAIRNHLERLEEQKKMLEYELSSKREVWKKEERENRRKSNDLDQKYNARKKVIDAYSSLRSSGIEDEIILRLDRILIDSKVDPRVLEAELKKTSHLKRIHEEIETDIEHLGGEREKLRFSIKELNTNVQELTTTKSVLTSSIESTKVNLKDSIESLANLATSQLNTNALNAKNLLDAAEKGISELRSEVSEFSKVTKTGLRGAVDDLSTSVSDIKNEIARLLEDAKTTGEKIGKLDLIVRAYEFLSSGTGSKEEVVPAISSMLYNLKSWCTYRGYSFDTEIDSLMDRLNETL